MKVLIIGGGGREHALAWKAAQSPIVSEVFVAPGNTGTQLEAGITNVPIESGDYAGLLRFAIENSIGLTIVGPEAPLVDGIVDLFVDSGLKCFGPTASAARLEGSKTFAKSFLEKYHIPTARYQSFTEIAPAVSFAKVLGFPLVIKADGLAAGKGVVIADSLMVAEQAIQDMLAGNKFGEAGHCVVIEEFLKGEEASFICIVSGKDILPMATSQDHKAAYDGDTGPNTGGMGAYSPAPVVDDEMHRLVMRDVINPTVQGLIQEGIHYTGFLYAGLMIGEDGVPRVLEFNCRFGDPETQPIMMRLKSDLVSHCVAAVDGALAEEKAIWDSRAALGIVMAAQGYPDSYRKGDVINGLDGNSAEAPNSESVKVFHAGTQSLDGDIVTAGGRVLCVTGIGQDIQDAQTLAYAAAKKIHWQGSWFRRDIGYRAVSRI